MKTPSNFIFIRTRFRSWRNGAVLGSKRPRHITKNTKYFLIIIRSAVSKWSLINIKLLGACHGIELNNIIIFSFCMI